MANRNHANHLSSFLYDDLENNSETWASGNTKTITNSHVKSTSFIILMWTGTPTGTQKIVCSDGSFVITSSDAMTNIGFKYRIL